MTNDAYTLSGWASADVALELHPHALSQVTVSTERRKFNRVAMQNASIDALMVMDAEGTIVFWNHSAERLAGWEAHEVIGKPMLAWFATPQHGPRLEAAVAHYLASTRSQRFQYRIEMELIHRYASHVPVEASFWSFEDEGKPFFAAALRDITAQLAARKALQQSEERYRFVVEHAGEGMAVIQNDHFVFVNNSAAEIIGIARHHLLKRNILRLLHPDDRHLVLKHLSQRMARACVDPKFQARILRPNGDIIWIEINVNVVPWDGVLSLLGFFTDITARKQMEQSLERTYKERETLLNTALVGMGLTVNRHLQWVNDKYLEMFGYSREELVGRSTRMTFQDDETFAQAGIDSLASLMSQGTFTAEFHLVRRCGERFWCQVTGRTIVPGNPDAGVIWCLLDTNERRHAEDATRAALEKQTALNEMRSRFVTMTSHEFRNPLTAIMSSANMLQHYRNQLTPQDYDEALSNMVSSVTRMTGMLDEILLIGQSEANLLIFQPHTLNVLPWCEALVRDIQREVPMATGRVHFQCAAQRTTGQFDEKLLRHIFSNLLSNAIKYSPQGGHVTLSLREDATALIFEVSDQGMGIPEHELPQLFEAFHRASNVGDIQGTGLGLSIVKKSVELHGGTIRVLSTLGSGTRFTVELLP